MKLPARFPLAVLPTPLVRAARLERALGSPPIYVKRDDLTGFAVGGNKARKLEMLVADALGREADVLVTGGGPGSNHCAAAAAAAQVAGLRCVLVLYGHPRAAGHPNLALALSFGAEVRFTGDPERASVDAALEEAAAKLEADGENPYLIPRGGASGLGAAGYAAAARELAGQLAGEGVEPEVVLVATGSGATQAGLLAGTVAGGHPWRVVGAAVSRPVEECRARVLRLARQCAGLLGTREPGEADVLVAGALGPGYGVPSGEGAAAAAVAARAEGLLLDPVFTAKAMGALISLRRSGPAVFVHTGGVVAAIHERLEREGVEDGGG